MSDYKENTVGWWLSQLKEPLRSRALESGKSAKVLDDLCSEMWRAFWRLAKNTDSKPDKLFFLGASDFFEGLSDDIGPITLSGYKMAKECVPGGEEKQPKVWTAEDIQQHLVENPHTSAYGPHGEVLHQGKPIIIESGLRTEGASPAPGEFQWDDNTVIDFATWYLKMTGLYEHRFEIENQDILDSFKRGDDPYLWRKPKETDPPETWSEKEVADWKETVRVDMSKYFPKLIHSEALGDNQVLFMGEDGPVLADPPVPGAKPIATVMTIEMQHEKRIEALEARVKEVTDSIKNVIYFINTFYGTK